MTIMRKRQRQWLVGTLCSGPPLGQLARHQQCVRVQGSAYIALNLIQYVKILSTRNEDGAFAGVGSSCPPTTLATVQLNGKAQYYVL